METCNNGCYRPSIIKKQFIERITAGTKIEAIVSLYANLIILEHNLWVKGWVSVREFMVVGRRGKRSSQSRR